MSDPRPLSPDSGPWLIWSVKWGKWHRRDAKGLASGYTEDIIQAGIFDYEIARLYHATEENEVRTFGGALWRMQDRARDLRAEYLKAAAAVEKIKQLHERSKLKRLPPHQRAVLRALVDDEWSDDRYYSHYQNICTLSGLTRTQARRAMLALRRLGFVEFSRGLWTEDGEPAGAGWRASKDGTAWWWDHEAKP